MMIRAVVLAMLLIVALAEATSPQKVQAPLPVEDLLSARSFSNVPIDLSPDGEWLAYSLKAATTTRTLQDERYRFFTPTGVPFDGHGCDVWVTNLTSRESRNLTEGEETGWGASWSPNGRSLAYYSDQGGRAGLWIWDRSTNQKRQVPGIIVRPFFGNEVPRWTPDGKKIISKVLPDGMSLEDAANLFITTPTQTKPASDGTSAKVTVFTSGLTADSNSEKKANADKTNSNLDRYLSDLAIIDVASAGLRRLARRYRIVGQAISPDGERVAFNVITGNESGNSQQTLYDLLVVSLADPHPLKLASSVKLSYGVSMSWSPDSKLLCYVTVGTTAKGDVLVVPATGGTPRNLTEGTHPNFGDPWRVPIWNGSGNLIYCVGNNELWAVSVHEGGAKQITKDLNRTILGIVTPLGKYSPWLPHGPQTAYLFTRDNVTKRTGFFKVDVATGKSTAVLEGSKSFKSPVGFNSDVSDDGKRFVFIAQDAQQSEDVWVVDSDLRNAPRRISNANPQFDRYTMGASRIVTWESDDGQKLRGALLLPTDYKEGKHYPMIVDVYGGRMGSDSVNVFGLWGVNIANRQLLATRGYAVLIPDIPLRPGTPMRDIARAVLPGVNKIVELGIADPDRLGVMGSSYGGYCVLALIVQTTRFKAAIDSAGFGNLIGNYGQMGSTGTAQGIGWAEEGQGNMRGTPWEVRERYIENSPVFYLDRVTTPLMIVQGTADPAVPSFLADEVFVDLRRLGKEAVYVKYEGEGHTETSFNYASSVDYFNRMIAWFDKYLKAPEKTVSSKQKAESHKQ